MMIETKDFRDTMAELIRDIKKDISDEYRAFEHEDEPGIQLTVATDDMGAVWNFQTGDNSYTGGAYGLPHWAVIGVYRDTGEYDAADDIVRQLLELVPEQWSGYPDPADPDNFWIDDNTGERVNAHTGERS